MTNRNGLKEFLLGNKVPPGRADKVMAKLEPFFLMAEGKRPFLTAANQTTVAQACAALKTVLGATQVQTVLLVSISRPFVKPEWMTEEVYQKAIKESFRTMLADPLRDTLWTMLADPLHDELLDTLWGTLLDTLGTTLWDTFRDILFLYLFSEIAVGQQAEQTAKLEALVELVTQGWLPVGNKKDEPQTWLVMVG